MEQEPQKARLVTPQDQLRQLKEHLEGLREVHREVQRRADQLQGNPEYRDRLVVSQVKDNLAADLLDLLENPNINRPEPVFPDPLESGELEEEGSSW